MFVLSVGFNVSGISAAVHFGRFTLSYFSSFLLTIRVFASVIQFLNEAIGVINRFT
ncbi:MAG: hypothetical protein ACJASL_004360 [Paraglaciecola sp.]|jgi:hypothetical protein